MLKRTSTVLLLLLLSSGIASCSLIDNNNDDKPAVAEKPVINSATKRLAPSEVESAVADFFAKLPLEIKNDYWPRNGYIPGENLVFKDKFDYETASAGSEAKKGLAITSGPVVAEDKVFTLGGKGELQARKINDISETLWEVNINEVPTKKDESYFGQATAMFKNESQFIGGNICYSLGVVYVTTKRGYLYAVNAKDGAVLWSKNYGVTIRSTPVAREDKLVFITSDNRTIAVNAKDGSILWKHQGLIERSKVMSSPAPLLIDDKIVVTYSSGEVFELNFDTGSEIWNAEVTTSLYGTGSAFMSDISTNPVYHNGVIYISSSDGTLSALDQNGKLLWSFEGEIINRSVWPVGDFLFTTSRFGDIIAISAWNGKLVWKNKMAGSKEIHENKIQFTGLVMAGGKLYAADDQGSLYSYTTKDGSTIGKFSIPDDVYLTPVVADGKMFLLNKNAKLIVLK